MVNAIIRFSSRQPGATTFISDHGTNLVGADAIMRREMESWRNSAANCLQERGIEWSFIVAGTPHLGVIWERVVVLFKKHIASATRGDVLHVDTFNTIVIEVEGILNKRPLTPISTDPLDTEAISPCHILYPATFSHSAATIVPEHPEDGPLRITWKQAQSRVNAFWNSWSVEYLALLHSRSKWRSTQRDLKVGDLVILVDKMKKHHDWKMGRVVLVKGRDNHVTRARIKRGDGRIVLKDGTEIVHLELDGGPRNNDV